MGTALEATESAAVAQRKDGSRFPVSVYMNWLSSGDGPVGVAALIDVSERVEPEFPETLARAVRFEQFVSDLTSSFVDLPPQDVDAAIEGALHLLLEALDLDRCTIFQVMTPSRICC